MKCSSATCLVLAVPVFLASSAGVVRAEDPSKPAAVTRKILADGEDAMKKVVAEAESKLATITIKTPSQNEARRKELFKALEKIKAEYRAAIRDQRREMVEAILQAEKGKRVTEEDRRRAEAEAERMTDTYMKNIDDLLAEKEKEIMEV